MENVVIKIGDIVEITHKGWPKEFGFGSRHKVVGRSSYDEAALRLCPINGGNEGVVSEGKLRLVNPLEEAKALLEAEGYSVVAPKSKRSAEVVMYENSQGVLCTVPKGVYDGWSKLTRRVFSILAITTITEGDGL